jgi:predicted RNA-binding protein with PUA-like domain
VAGTARVVKAASPDPSQWDPSSDYHDAGSPRDQPRWFGVHIALDRIFDTPLPLDQLREVKALAKMTLLQRSRLSVQPVAEGEWKTILGLAGIKK